jgi:hypothetical protein
VDRHIEIVNAAVAFHRALWKLRATLNESTEQVLARKKVPETCQRQFDSFRAELAILRKAWPQFTEAQCVDVATTVTQAASVGLMNELRAGQRSRKPHFSGPSTIRWATKATLMWMFHVAERHISTEEVDKIVLNVEDGPLTSNKAQRLRDSMIRAMPGILQWADDQIANDKAKRQKRCR